MTSGVATPQTEQQPPSNLEAEETVLGALLLAGAQNTISAFDNVRETGLQRLHFFRASHGQVYGLILELVATGQPFDPITVAARIPVDSDLGPGRIHELASIVPAVGLAPHHAKLVIEAHRRRQAWRLAKKLEQASLNGGITTEITAELQDLLDEPNQHTAIAPLWLTDALTEAIPDTAEYVDGVLETGVLADIVGLPYLHKSAVALELAVKVAKGRGLLLGKYAIKAQAKVAYFWADDSRPQELKRIQAYAAANQLDEHGRDLPVGFYLNPGLSIPEDLPTIKRQIREHGYRLVVFDSLYNFADFDFVKDTGAVKHLYTALKRLCDDIEGLTIVLVDHASKPSDSNRDRDDSISSYGAVWKAAAVRCSIVVTKKGQSLFVSATGNNVKGFPRTPAYFNQERLELTIAEEKEADPERVSRIDDAVLAEVTRKPGQSSNQIEAHVKGRSADIRAALARLENDNLILNTYGKASQLPTGESQETSSGDAGTNRDERTSFTFDSSSHETGRTGTKRTKTAWIPLNKAEEPRPDDNGTTPDEPRPDHGSFHPESSSQTSSPYVVGGGAGTNPQESLGTQEEDLELERQAVAAAADQDIDW